MAKKQQRQAQVGAKKQQDDKVTLADQLGGDLLAQLKSAKKELEQKEQAAKQAAKEQAIKEKKQREKNMSFSELLDEYGFGDTNSKK